MTLGTRQIDKIISEKRKKTGCLILSGSAPVEYRRLHSSSRSIAWSVFDLPKMRKTCLLSFNLLQLLRGSAASHACFENLPKVQKQDICLRTFLSSMWTKAIAGRTEPRKTYEKGGGPTRFNPCFHFNLRSRALA